MLTYEDKAGNKATIAFFFGQENVLLTIKDCTGKIILINIYDNVKIARHVLKRFHEKPETLILRK